MAPLLIRIAGSSAAALAVSLLVMLAVPGDARAQGHLDARYEVTVAGILIGKGTWEVDIAEDQFSATVTGGSSGIMSAIASGHGSGGSQGRVVKGQLQPATYTATITTDRKSETLRMTLGGGNVKDFSIEPPPPPPDNPNRIPLTEAHKRGVIDPMTASLLNIPGNGDPVSAEACNGGGAVFDGRMRYELTLEFKRIETVKVDGYQGPVAVCAIYFTPIAGYDPTRAAIKYLAAQRQMELWLAPIAGTRVLVPYRLTIPTPIGTGKLQATRFVSTATVARGGPAPKTQ